MSKLGFSNTKQVSFHKKERKKALASFCSERISSSCSCWCWPSVWIYFLEAAGVPLGSLVLPALVFELLSGPKHTLQIDLQALPLTFHSGNANGSRGAVRFAKVLTALSHRPWWTVWCTSLHKQPTLFLMHELALLAVPLEWLSPQTHGLGHLKLAWPLWLIFSHRR